MIIPLFVVGILALPRWLPAESNPLTVTMWWMIFNQPAFCRGGGSESALGMDLTNTETEPALIWAAEQQAQSAALVSVKASLPVTSQTPCKRL